MFLDAPHVLVPAHRHFNVPRHARAPRIARDPLTPARVWRRAAPCVVLLVAVEASWSRRRACHRIEAGRLRAEPPAQARDRQLGWAGSRRAESAAPKAAVKENPGSAGGRDNQTVRMVGTGPGPPWGMSGHSSGTVGGREDTRTTQKCPSRLARPARLERATLRFEA